MFGKRRHATSEEGGETKRRGGLRVWLGRLGLAGLVLVVLAIGGLAWLMHSASRGELTERLLHFGNQLLTSSSNLRVYVSRLRVSGGTIEFQSLQVDAREGGRWYRVLDAKSGHFRANLQDVALRRPQVFDVRLSSPVFHYVTAADGKAVLPQFQPTGKGGQGGVDNGFVLTLDDASLRAHARGDSSEWWEHGNLVARLRPEGRGYVIGLEHAKGRCPPLGLVLRSGSGRATAAADTIRLASLTADTDAGRVRLSGSLEGHNVSGEFQADDWPWEFFGDLLEQPLLDVPGGVSVRGQISGPVEQPEFRTILDGHWRQEPFQGEIDGRVITGGLAVSRANLSWRQTRFAGTANFAQGGRWAIGGRVSAVDLSQVEHLFPGIKLPKSNLGGPARISGSQGTLQLATQNLSGSVNDLPLENMTGSWQVVGHRHQVRAQGTVAGGSLALNGGWDPHQISLSGSASHEDLSRLGSWVPSLEKAKGRLEDTRWSITGTMASPRVSLDGAVSGAELPPASAGWVGFHYKGVWSKAPTGWGNIEARDLAVQGWRADTLWADARHQGKDVSFSPIQAVHGDTTLVASVEIQPREHGLRILADSLRIDSERGWVAADGPIDIESDRGAWVVHRATLTGSAGRLELQGRYHNENDFDLALQGRGLAASELAALANAHGWGGDLTLDAHMTADAAARRLDVALQASHLVSPVLNADSVNAVLQLQESGGTIEVQKLHAALGHSVLDGSGKADLPRGKWPLDPSKWGEAARHASGWRGQVTLKDFDLSRLSSIWPSLEGIEGRATGSLNLGGSPSAPEGGSEGTLSALFYKGHPIEPIQWRARYENKEVRIEDLRVGLGDSAAIMHGTIPLDLSWNVGHGKRIGDRPVDIQFDASKVSLGEIATFLPFVAYSDGVLAAHLHLGGVPGRWRPTGTVDILKGRVRFTGREEVYRDFQAHLVLDSTLVRIASLKATQGKDGSFSGSGTITLGRGIQTYDIKLQAINALALSSGEYEAHFDGTLHVGTGPRLPGSWFPLPDITGNLTVRDGIVLYDFADPTNRVYFAGPKQTPAFVYDIDVYGEKQIYWRTPSANVELKVDASVAQTMDDWRVLGTVEALRGSYYFLENKFQVDSGMLVFDSVEPMNPNVIASAHADVRNADPNAKSETIRVTIDLSGRIQTPEIAMSDDQGHSKSDIVKLLTLGRYGGLNNGQIAGAYGGTYLLRQLSTEFPELKPFVGDVEFGTQVVRGSGTSSEIVPTAGFRRDFSSVFSLNYSQILGMPTQNYYDLQVRDFGAEYKINRIFYLTGEILERRPGSTGTTTNSQSQYEYNLDLRARHEY
jgi:translocation-and-assembly-module (TAM) inner membrane subunit TamB-like protein